MHAWKRPIGVDLFAGAGGMSLGFEQAGFDVAAAVEFDPIHCAVHEYNFPNCAPICRSVADIDAAHIRNNSRIGDAEVDVVFGGAPCQGFSMIGKLALDDPRNSLANHFVRLVVDLQARCFVFENVRGPTVGEHKRFLEEIMLEFGRRGYRIVEDYRVLNAANYGVPQDRHRLFLFGARKGQPLPSYPTPTHRAPVVGAKGMGNLFESPTPTVWEALRDLPEADDYAELLERDWVRARFKAPSSYATTLRDVRKDPGDLSAPREFDPGLLTSSLRTIHTDLSKRRFRETPHGDTEPVSRFLKLDPEGICNTLRAGTASDRGAFTSPRPIHPFSARCITVREAARLHSYPDWFRFHVTKWHGFRQIGNSVPPAIGTGGGVQCCRSGRSDPAAVRDVAAAGESGPALARHVSGCEPLQCACGCHSQADQDARGADVNRYSAIIREIFERHYQRGSTNFEFSRDEFEQVAKAQSIKLPKNVGDLIYSFRFRTALPEEINATAGAGMEWMIELAGRGRYRFVMGSGSRIHPRQNLVAVKIPDATPEIIAGHAMSDEQALLAKVRYNRLIDVFMGMVAYSLQNHLRTTVKGMGQIEVDELYMGVNRNGQQFVVPVQAKGGTDQLGVMQTKQNFACCREKFPKLTCRPVAAQFMADDVIALFELTLAGGVVEVVEEKHYKLVRADQIGDEDLLRYSGR